MNRKLIIAAIMPLMSFQGFAQNAVEEFSLDSIEVIGTRIPLSPKNSVRIVQVIDAERIARSQATSVNDLLKLVSGVDVRQRGGFGIQTDIGVNGGTADQLTVLLNGVNISNSHTGHLTMDLPVSVSDIERIEVLEGGASRVYGSSAFSGAINIVTKSASEALSADVSAGSFGTLMASASAGLGSGSVSNRVAASYSRSDGGTDNSDFNKFSAFVNGGYNRDNVEVSWQTGASTMNYGANTFYSASFANQYEENRRYMAAVSARLKGKVTFSPQAYWNRSMDHYLLKRDDPSFYENFHQFNAYGLNLNAYTRWSLGKTAIGAEIRKEKILSNTLGKPMEEKDHVNIPGHDGKYTNSDGRTLLSYYLEHDVTLGSFNISLGLLANRNTGLDHRFRLYPGVDISWNLPRGWKAYASFNQALRMPTFTDLYYKSPTINGNIGLKPEKSTDYTLGLQYSSPAFQMKAKAFLKKGTDMIDWVKYDAQDSYHSTNFSLDTYGLEWDGTADITEMIENPFVRSISLGYAYIYQKRKDDKQFYLSNHAMDYLKNKLTASLTHNVVRNVILQWDLRLFHRMGEFEYYENGANTGTLKAFGTNAILDAKLQWMLRDMTLYVQASNLTSNRYYDLGNVRQPGIWVMSGIRLSLR